MVASVSVRRVTAQPWVDQDLRSEDKSKCSKNCAFSLGPCGFVHTSGVTYFYGYNMREFLPPFWSLYFIHNSCCPCFVESFLIYCFIL